MIYGIPLEDILFLDIETVPGIPRFDLMDEELQNLWADKHRFILERDGLTPEELYEKAGIYAEFGKIICISTAIFHEVDGQLKLRVKSFFGDDEKVLLDEFARMLDRYTAKKSAGHICGHNIREFDVPYVARRMLINGLKLPSLLDLAGKKPWEVYHLDTMALWKFGDYKHFTSLALLARIFGIPTPKDDISGADVAKVYWEDKDLGRIKTYCEKDTITVARLMQKFRNSEMIGDEHIEYVD